MENFDIDINFNGTASDIQYLNTNGDDKKTPENTDLKEEKPKPKKTEVANKIDKYTNLFKELTGYETPAEREQRIEKEKSEVGQRKTILGLNPFVAIGLSLALVVVGTVVVVKLKVK